MVRCTVDHMNTYQYGIPRGTIDDMNDDTKNIVKKIQNRETFNNILIMDGH